MTTTVRGIKSARTRMVTASGVVGQAAPTTVPRKTSVSRSIQSVRAAPASTLTSTDSATAPVGAALVIGVLPTPSATLTSSAWIAPACTPATTPVVSGFGTANQDSSVSPRRRGPKGVPASLSILPRTAVRAKTAAFERFPLLSLLDSLSRHYQTQEAGRASPLIVVELAWIGVLRRGWAEAATA